MKYCFKWKQVSVTTEESPKCLFGTKVKTKQNACDGHFLSLFFCAHTGQIGISVGANTREQNFTGSSPECTGVFETLFSEMRKSFELFLETFVQNKFATKDVP